MFFKALERAEQERTLGRPATPPPASQPAPAGSDPKPTAARPPESVFMRPVPTTFGLDEHSYELEEHLVSLLAPTSFEAEQYRALRHMIEQHHGSTDLSVIAVTSPDAGDGKSTTAINLAGALAQARDARVLLVDGDLRGANLASYLGLDDQGAPGLVDAILDRNLTFEAVVQKLPHLNLSVISAGRRPSAPYEILKSPRVGELLAEARKTGKWVDGFLIVVAAHRTARKLLEEALNVIEQTKIVGLVFNGDDHHISKGSYSSKRFASGRGTKGRLDGLWNGNRSSRRHTASDD